MGRKTTILLLLACCFVIPATAQDDLEAAARRATIAYRAAETDEAKLKILTDYLDEYPDSEHTGNALRNTVRIMKMLDGNPGRAVHYTEGIVPQINDAKVKTTALFILADLCANPEYGARLDGITRQLKTASGGLSCRTYRKLIINAIGGKQWDLVFHCVEEALPLATRENLIADYPNNKFTEEQLNKYPGGIKSILLGAKGWAESNKGKTDQALATFEEAEKLAVGTFSGVPTDNLWLYKGLTLVKTGKTDKALDLLIPQTMYTRNGSPQADEKIRETYIERNGSDDGFNNYFRKMRVKYAKVLDNFELKDFSGKKRSFKELKGKVTILTFWSPG